MNYYGLTHFLGNSRILLWLWEKIYCPHGIHAFDEVWSPAHGEGKSNYLFCDPCGLIVYISGVNEKHTNKKLEGKE